MIRCRNLFIPVLLLACSLKSNESPAQNHQDDPASYSYRAMNWGLVEKFPVVPVYQMLKDVNGFMWIATRGEGLIRFDGNIFKNYRHETNNINSLSGNEIRGLIEDSLHNIWIGSENGLWLYDIKADTFKTIINIGTKYQPPFSVVPFWATKDEVFCWDYPDSQWAAFNIHTLSKRKLAKMSNDDMGKPLSRIYSIFDSGSNSIWIEYGEGGPGGGLLQVSLSTGKKIPFTWNCFRNIPNDDHAFEGMHYDRKRNAIWISCTDGLVEFTLDDKKFHHIASMDSLVQLKGYHLWAGINIDTLGRIWMGTFPTGIIIYDPDRQSLRIPFPNDSNLQQKISTNNVMIYCDRDGMVWTGSWKNEDGIYQLIPFSPPVHQYVSQKEKSNSLSSDFTIECFDAGQRKMMIGTSDGLNIFDTETGFFQVLRKKDLPGLVGEVHEISIHCIDTLTQKAWISTASDDQMGMRCYQMDLRSKKCIPILFKDSANKNLIIRWGIPRPLKNGTVMAAEMGNRILVFIGNTDSLVFKQILSFPIGTIDLFEISSDDSHLLFFKHGDSVANLSYTLVHGKWILAHTPIDSIQWANIAFNELDQSYWINADNGLLHINRDFQLIRAYTERDGLPGGERGRVISDNHGNIWFAMNHSIQHLNIMTGRISTLSAEDGFQPNGFFLGLIFRRSNTGDLYLPSGVNGKGFTRISPDKYINPISTVYIQSLLVNQQPYHFSPGINNNPEIKLRYFENRFTVEPGIIDFYSEGKNQFRYRLRESEAWIYPHNNIIYYDNLSPGIYDLIMQSSNTNDFNGPITTLHIHIDPPWWKTGWAYTLFGILFALLLWVFIQYRSRALRAKNIQLEEKVLHRTKELKLSLEELRETQTQLIQREKMASLGELTAGIAHEIQNPLNFVNNFSEVNGELIDELENELNAGNITDAIPIVRNIKENEYKINHHGKRADAIVKGMLQHSRTSKGEKELTDINALADEYMRLSYHGLRAKEKSFNATFKSDFDQSIGKINIIPQDIGRVLLNIYNNAFYSVMKKETIG